jgi:hypothetical protein
MGPNPSYDNLSAFIVSYAELSALYDTKATSYYGGSSSSPDTFPPQLRHAPVVIAALLARGHLPTTNVLEFVGMVAGSGDLIFDTLCMNSDSNLSPHESSKEEPSDDKENKNWMADAPPSAR